MQRSRHILLHHAVKGVIGKSGGVDRRRPSIYVPSVSVGAVVQQVPIRVAACPAKSVVVRRRTVARLPCDGPALSDVSKGIVGKGLRPHRAAICGRDAAQIVVHVVAGLRVGTVKGIGDGQGF